MFVSLSQKFVGSENMSYLCGVNRQPQQQNDTLHEERGDMECLVARRGHRTGGGVRHHLPGVVLPERQRLGEGRGDPLSFRDARLLSGLDSLSFDEAPLQVEGAAAQVGPCRHLLAHRRLLLAAHADGPPRTGLLGLEPLLVRLALCDSGHYRQFHPPEGAFESGDVLLHRDGAERARGLQAAPRFSLYGRRHLDHRRGRLLHHGRRLLLAQQEEVYALRVPLLCPRRLRLPHHRRLGCADGILVIVNSEK